MTADPEVDARVSKLEGRVDELERLVDDLLRFRADEVAADHARHPHERGSHDRPGP